MKYSFSPASASRVEINTSKKSIDRISAAVRRNVTRYMNASKADISERIRLLNKEWDTERILEANASAII